jgi:hypothetical protein
MRKMYDSENTELWLEFDFNILLHKRGSDWWVYKNQWDKAFDVVTPNFRSGGFFDKRHDTELIKHLVLALMADDTGVHSVTIMPYTLKVFKSTAVDDKIVVDVINRVGAELGLDN